MNLKTLTLSLAAAALLLAPDARAQGFGISFGKPGKWGAYVNVPLCQPGPPASRYVRGHYETRCEDVWVAGCSERVWIEACYETRYHCGRAVRVLVRPGYWKTIQQPGHYETRTVRVWVPGHWERC